MNLLYIQVWRRIFVFLSLRKPQVWNLMKISFAVIPRHPLFPKDCYSIFHDGRALCEMKVSHYLWLALLITRIIFIRLIIFSTFLLYLEGTTPPDKVKYNHYALIITNVTMSRPIRRLKYVLKTRYVLRSKDGCTSIKGCPKMWREL